MELRCSLKVGGGGGGGEERGAHICGGQGQSGGGGWREGFTGVVRREGVSRGHTRETPAKK